MTAYRRLATLFILTAASFATADTKGIGKYPCDPHPVPKLPPIILPPIPKLPYPGPTLPPTKQAPPAPAKVVKGK